MRICMLAYTFYESDGRVMMYAEALVNAGAEVDVIALSRNGQPHRERIHGVSLYRIQKRKVNERGKLSYFFRIVKFFILSSLFCTVKHIQKRYDVIHVHSIPDFEVFAALIPKLFGAKIILDIHDLVPEFYADKFDKLHTSLMYRLLLWFEKISIAFSDHVIIANDLWYEKISTRTGSNEKITSILNYPDPSLFHRRKRKSGGTQFRIIYPGSLNWHQGLDVAIRAFYRIRNEIPHADFHVYGEGSEKERLRQLVGQLDLNGRVFIHEKVPTSTIPQLIAESDLGIVPKRSDSFGNEAFSTKILEFMAIGVPVIVSNTEIDRFYFNESLVTYFNSGDEQDLADSIRLIYSNSELRQRLVLNSFKFIAENNWEVKKHVYLMLVKTLIEEK